jgi:hypothetical protein
MTDWFIAVPHRARDESLVAAAGHARHLPEPDRDTARELVLAAHQRGLRSVGELLESLETLDPVARRALLEEARAAAGQPPTAEVDARAQVQAASRMRAGAGELVACAIEGCQNFPIRAETGAIYIPNVKAWHCPAHEHLAAPGVMEPHRWRHGPSGGIELVNDAQELADAADAESARRRAEQANEIRAVAAAAARAEEDARHEAMDAELPASLRRRPAA